MVTWKIKNKLIKENITWHKNRLSRSYSVISIYSFTSLIIKLLERYQASIEVCCANVINFLYSCLVTVLYKFYEMISFKRKFYLRKANRLYHRRTSNLFSLGLGLQIMLASLISEEIVVIPAKSPFSV